MGIVITLSGTQDNPKVIAKGYNQGLLTEKDLKNFGLTKNALADAYGKASGRRPDGVTLNGQEMTGKWSDQSYDRYGWDDCVLKMYPKSARIIANETKPVALQRTNFDNSESKVNTSYKVEVNKTVTHTVTRSWDIGVSVGISNTISWEIGGEAFGGKIGGETTVSVTSSYNKSNGWSKDESLSYLSGAEVTLKPGQMADAVVSVTDGYMLIKVDYEISIHGRVCFNYNKKHKGHYLWSRSLRYLTNKPLTKHSTERTKIDAYSEGSIKLISL